MIPYIFGPVPNSFQPMMRNYLPILLAGALGHATFAPDDVAQEGLLRANTRQLIFEGKRSGEGYFSPNGKQLIFQSERDAGNPFYQICKLDFETGDTKRVSPEWENDVRIFSSPARSACFSLRRMTTRKQPTNKKRSWIFARAENSAAIRGITMRHSKSIPRSRTVAT